MQKVGGSVAAGRPTLLPEECTPIRVKEGEVQLPGLLVPPQVHSPPMDVSPSPSLGGTCALIQEVGQEAAHDSLVGDDEDVALAFQLHDDGLQPLHQVLVGLWREVGQAGRKLGELAATSVAVPRVKRPLLLPPQLAFLLEAQRLHVAC